LGLFVVVFECASQSTYPSLTPSLQRKATGSFKVVCDTYVTSDSGTGIVHQAPAFGEDDMRVCIHNKIVDPEGGDLPCPINESGIFTKEALDYQGMYIKQADTPIQKDLKARGRLIRQTRINHSYPFCWR
jgi:isoleucyl-tRNA synthetase